MKKLIFLLLGFFLWQSALSQVYILTNKGTGFVKLAGSTLVTGTPDSVVVSANAVVDSNTFATRYWVGTQVGGTVYTLVAKLANDATTGANVTPISLTGLVFNYEANSTYRIHWYGSVSAAAATTGCGFQFDLSSAVTSIRMDFFHQLANTGTLSGGSSIADDASAGVSSGIPANGGIYPVMGSGLLITAGNTGTAQLRYRSETTAATTCKAGTVLVVEKIQ